MKAVQNAGNVYTLKMEVDRTDTSLIQKACRRCEDWSITRRPWKRWDKTWNHLTGLCCCCCCSQVHQLEYLCWCAFEQQLDKLKHSRDKHPSYIWRSNWHIQKPLLSPSWLSPRGHNCHKVCSWWLLHSCSCCGLCHRSFCSFPSCLWSSSRWACPQESSQCSPSGKSCPLTPGSTCPGCHHCLSPSNWAGFSYLSAEASTSPLMKGRPPVSTPWSHFSLSPPCLCENFEFRWPEKFESSHQVLSSEIGIPWVNVWNIMWWNILLCSKLHSSHVWTLDSSFELTASLSKTFILCHSLWDNKF